MNKRFRSTRLQPNWLFEDELLADLYVIAQKISLKSARMGYTSWWRGAPDFLPKGAPMKKLMILAIALMAPALATAAEDRANLNDAQVAAIVVAANQIDIDAGKLAESKSPNPEVKAFAHRMVADHTDVNKQATDLATKLKMTPEENTISRAPTSDANGNLARLRKLRGN